MTPGLFITGTDTHVGKTYVTAMIARQCVAARLRVGVYKPAESGLGDFASPGQVVCDDDATILWNAAGRPGRLKDVAPQRFAAPLAPHLAARAEGKQLDEDLLLAGVDLWRASSDIVLVEGAGGLLSPLGESRSVADLAAELGYPLVVVARNALGTIHQTLATLSAAKETRLHVAATVLTTMIESPDASVETNAPELRRRMPTPLLATVAWNAVEFQPPLDWPSLATHVGEDGP